MSSVMSDREEAMARFRSSAWKAWGVDPVYGQLGGSNESPWRPCGWCLTHWAGAMASRPG